MSECNAALCRHVGSCGGCAYRDLPAADYRALKRAMLVDGLRAAGLNDAIIAETVESAPSTRRRASFKAVKRDGAVALGFHAARSHAVVDMLECRVLTQSMTALVPGLRAMLAAMLHEGEATELHVTEADNGFDVVLRWKRVATPKLIAELAGWAGRLDIARIIAGGETLVALQTPRIRLGAVDVELPPGAFLQPTKCGEGALHDRVITAVRGSKWVADLFSGCGTFTLAIARQARVHAVEQDSAMVRALATAVRSTQGLKPVTTEMRDLFKRPLGPQELAKFDAVVLDPPRAGAAAQIKALTLSKVGRIVYVSCNPASFARDARLLVEAGYRMGPVVPVDQFLWSSHIELVSTFERDSRKP